MTDKTWGDHLKGLQESITTVYEAPDDLARGVALADSIRRALKFGHQFSTVEIEDRSVPTKVCVRDASGEIEKVHQVVELHRYFIWTVDLSSVV
jgi:hypothetical protein